MKPYEKYLQPCVFERAGKNVDVSAAYMLADKRPLYPTPNEVDTVAKEADRLYELGCAHGTLDPAKVPLPVLEFNMYVDDTGSEINRVLQPGTPYRPDVTCYSVCATFITGHGSVVCHLNLGDSNDSGAGERDVGIFSVTDHGPDGIELHIGAVNGDALAIWAPFEIEDIVRWLYVMWRGIQYKLIFDPGKVTVHDYELDDDLYRFYTDRYAPVSHIVRTTSVYLLRWPEEKEVDKDA